MSEVGWGRPHTSSDSDCNPSRNPSSDSNGMRGIWTPGQPNPIVSEGEFRLGLQSESELGWGRPHPSSDMETPPPVEVAYSKSPGQPIPIVGFRSSDSDGNPSRGLFSGISQFGKHVLAVKNKTFNN